MDYYRYSYHSTISSGANYGLVFVQLQSADCASFVQMAAVFKLRRFERTFPIALNAAQPQSQLTVFVNTLCRMRYIHMTSRWKCADLRSPRVNRPFVDLRVLFRRRRPRKIPAHGVSPEGGNVRLSVVPCGARPTYCVVKCRSSCVVK